MKTTLTILMLAAGLLTVRAAAAGNPGNAGKVEPGYYIDVHVLDGAVTAEAVAAAHEKDLATQDAHDVRFEKYWVDEERGLVYCLSQAPDAAAVTETHREAHGLLPDHVYRVTPGVAAALRGGRRMFLDIHRLGPGAVTAEAVAAAHEKDLAVQDAYGVNFAQYWVDEADGVVICLSEADGPEAVRAAHREAHGLLPDQILEVVQGE